MQKIIFIFIKLKLLKKENILFVVFSRLFNLSKITFFNILSTINSPKFKSLPLRFLYFEELNNLVKQNFSEISYENKNILEVGGGNTWGLMPFFAKNNASNYTNIDVVLDKKIINSKFVWKKYLKKISQYISEKKINNLIFNNFECKIEDFYNHNKFDVVVSVSCLEHINDINSFFKNIKKFTNPNTTHLHIVNFTNHLSKKKPFKYIYENDKNYYLDNFQTKINLLRLSDFKKILEENSYSFKTITILKNSINEKNLHKYWKDNYDLDTLSISSAIIIIDGYSK